MKRGTATSLWSKDAIPNAVMKSEAKAGRMSEQLYAVGIKKSGGDFFPCSYNGRRRSLLAADGGSIAGGYELLGDVKVSYRPNLFPWTPRLGLTVTLLTARCHDLR